MFSPLEDSICYNINRPSFWLYRKNNKRPVSVLISFENADEEEIEIMNSNESK